MEENPFIPLLLILSILLIASRTAGAIARHFDQPRVLGELIVGVLLGPTLLNLLHLDLFHIEQAHLDETIHKLAELGVLLLMFKIGLEVHLEELASVGFVAGIAGVAGALLPVAVTIPIVMLFDYRWEPALFAGVTLAATSVSISAQVLMEIGVLRTKEGNALLATALIDDVVALLLVSLAVALTGSSEGVNAGEMLLIIVRMMAYIAIASVITWFYIPTFFNRLQSIPRLAHSYGIPTFALIIAFLFGWSAEYIGGVAAITGAFLAGIGISQAHRSIKRETDEAVSFISYAFLVPIFFVSVGLQTDLSTFPLDAVPLTVTLLIAAALTKIIGSGLGALLGGFNQTEALRLGVCMISRGEVGLIIATLGLNSGVFDDGDALFASLFMVILLTTVMTPPLVRRVFRSDIQRNEGAA